MSINLEEFDPKIIPITNNNLLLKNVNKNENKNEQNLMINDDVIIKKTDKSSELFIKDFFNTNVPNNLFGMKDYNGKVERINIDNINSISVENFYQCYVMWCKEIDPPKDINSKDMFGKCLGSILNMKSEVKDQIRKWQFENKNELKERINKFFK